jgi:ATP-binding cassette subfamily F protein uup
MAVLLSCRDLSKSFGARTLFRGIGFGIDDGERSGLIGPNGSGKSTLLKILADTEHADEGTVETRRGLRLGYVAQQDEFPEGATVESVLADAMKSVHVDEHDAVVRAGVVMGRVGFVDPHQQARTLSGGWRKRLSIARELVKEPDLLLMDEPTNHLDLEGIYWLEEMLRSSRFACLLVSHDRYFLENVTNRTIELSRAYPEGFLAISGTYDEFLVKRAEFLEAQKSEQQALASRVRREIEWLKRGAKARTTKAKGRIQQAQQMMGDLADIKIRNAQQQAVEVDFTASGRQTRKLLEMKGITKTLGGRTLFRDVNLVLSPKQKLGLLGPNGSGKSTLIRLMTGELDPDTGTIRRADGLRVVVFDQKRESLNPDDTLRRALSPKSDTVIFQGQPMHISGWARRFLFGSEQLDQLVSELSGGEQARVLIARLMLREADLLILDEPTNDLDIPTLEVLEESLDDFPGALVLVTHDRYLMDRLCTDILSLDGQGGWHPYAELAQWEAAREEQGREKKAEAKAQQKKADPAPAATPSASGAKRLSWAEKKEWETMEGTILEAEQAVERWQTESHDPKLATDHVRAKDVYAKLGEAQARVEKLYARWAELEAKQK